jgi:hypothetical protein
MLQDVCFSLLYNSFKLILLCECSHFKLSHGQPSSILYRNVERSSLNDAYIQEQPDFHRYSTTAFVDVVVCRTGARAMANSDGEYRNRRPRRCSHCRLWIREKCRNSALGRYIGQLGPSDISFDRFDQTAGPGHEQLWA